MESVYLINRNRQKSSYLEKSIIEGTVPKGISSQLKFTPSVHDSELHTFCKNVMNTTASILLDYFIQFYQERAVSTRSTYYSQKDKVKQRIWPEEFIKLETVLSNRLHKEKNECTKTHKSKIEWDRNESKIYITKEKHIITTNESTVINNPNGCQNTKKSHRRKNNNKKHRQSIARYTRGLIKGKIPEVADMSIEKMEKTVVNCTTVCILSIPLFFTYTSSA